MHAATQKTFAAALLAACLFAPACLAREESFTLAPFGKVTVYLPTPHPAHVALFVSGDGGWKLGVVDMAREIAGMDSLVAGVSIPAYMKNVGATGHDTASADPTVCFNPAADLEALGRAVEKRYGYANHPPPILIGYSSGATLVYAALVQAPPKAFGGAVSLGFCPDLIVNMPICKGNGLTWKRDPEGKGVDFQPSRNLEVPWIALQGDIDKICTPEDTRTYVSEVPHGELVWLHKVGHGFSVPKNWMAEFKDSYARVVSGARWERSARSSSHAGAPPDGETGSRAGDRPASEPAPPPKPGGEAALGGAPPALAPPAPPRPAAPAAQAMQPAPLAPAAAEPARMATGTGAGSEARLGRLPLTEVLTGSRSGAASASVGGSSRMAVLLTGDGGWRASDRRLAEALAAEGIPVVGWSSLRYFLHRRTPEEGAADLEAVLRHYLAAWHADQALVIGYSFGADVLPFFVDRLPEDLRARIPMMALVGPDRRADFRLTLADFLGRDGKDAKEVLPELRKLAGMPVLCSYGEQETASLCLDLAPELARVVRRPGGHRLAESSQLVAHHILDSLSLAAARPAVLATAPAPHTAASAAASAQ